MKAIIYAANVRVGGAVGGGAELMDAIAGCVGTDAMGWADSWSFQISNEIAREMSRLDDLGGSGIDLAVGTQYPNLLGPFRRTQPWADVRLILRGPEYAGRTARTEILGFADRSTLVAPMDSRARDRVRSVLRSRYKRALVRRYDAYLTQTEDMAARLRLLSPGKPVAVIPNSPGDIFLQALDAGRRANMRSDPGDTITLFYPARGYPHKNHAMIEPVARELRHRWDLRLVVRCTVTERDLAAIGVPLGDSIEPIGEVSRERCLEEYLRSDGVFFPTLNETSSVTPLEGMALGLPVFSSDIRVVSDISGTAPIYFDPRSPVDAATKIHAYFSQPAVYSERISVGLDFVRKLPSRHEKAIQHLALMKRSAVA